MWRHKRPTRVLLPPRVCLRARVCVCVRARACVSCGRSYVRQVYDIDSDRCWSGGAHTPNRCARVLSMCMRVCVCGFLPCTRETQKPPTDRQLPRQIALGQPNTEQRSANSIQLTEPAHTRCEDHSHVAHRRTETEQVKRIPATAPSRSSDETCAGALVVCGELVGGKNWRTGACARVRLDRVSRVRLFRGAARRCECLAAAEPRVYIQVLRLQC